jgi:hypothetical protein
MGRDAASWQSVKIDLGAGKGSTSFLKKRSKKLFPLWMRGPERSATGIRVF